MDMGPGSRAQDGQGSRVQELREGLMDMEDEWRRELQVHGRNAPPELQDETISGSISSLTNRSLVEAICQVRVHLHVHAHAYLSGEGASACAYACASVR